MCSWSIFNYYLYFQIKAKGKVYDFTDFEDCVKKACSGKVKVKSLKSTDFFLPFDYSSQYKITKNTSRPYLNDMVQIVFKRGSLDLHYKKDFSEQESKSLSFLKTGYLKKKSVPKPPQRTSDRGVNEIKKSEILKKLLPLMPQNRHAFWLNLPTSDLPDLLTEIDDWFICGFYH